MQSKTFVLAIFHKYEFRFMDAMNCYLFFASVKVVLNA